MKIIKIFRSTIISFIVIIIAAILGFVVWGKLGTYPVKDVASEALKSTDLVSISQDKWIVITPNEETNTGLIIYPGGLVEPTAYSPVLHRIAEKGVLIIITPMPLNIAIYAENNPNKIDIIAF
jgi:hypothetical protein